MDKKRKRKKTEMKFEISTFAKLILLKMHWNSSIFLEQQPECEKCFVTYCVDLST